MKLQRSSHALRMIILLSFFLVSACESPSMSATADLTAVLLDLWLVISTALGILYLANTFRRRSAATRTTSKKNWDKTDTSEKESSDIALFQSTILHAVAEGIVLVGANDGKIRFINKAMSAMMGYSAEELVGKDIAVLNAHIEKNPEDRRDEIMAKLQKCGEWHGEICNIRKDGTLVWCYANVSSAEIEGIGMVYISTHTDITEKKEAKERLHETERKYQNIIDISPVPLALNDPAGNITYLNPAFTQTFGYTREDIPTLSEWWQCAYPEKMYREYVAKTWQEAMETAERNNEPFKPVEVRITCKNGALKTVLARTSRIVESFHHEYLVLLFDISERVEAEKELVKLGHVIEQSPVSVIITDTAGNIEYANPKFSEVSGYSREEINGKTPRVLKSGLMPDNIFPEMWNTLKSGKDWRGEFVNRKKNGEIYWETAVISPILDSHGTITNFVAVKEDITDRKKASEALEAGEIRYRQLMEGVPVAIYLTDENGYLTIWNKAAEDLWGRIPELGTTRWCGAYRIFSPAGIPLELEQGTVAGAVKSRTPVAGAEGLGEKPDGTKYAYLANTTPIFDADGAFVGTMNVMMETTRQKESENLLREREERLRIITENTPGIIIELDKEGRILFINRIAIGIRREDVIGQNFVFWVPEHERPVLENAVRTVFGEGKTVHYRVSGVGDYGQMRKFAGRMSPITSKDGIVEKAILLTTDITVQFEAEERIERERAKSEIYLNIVPSIVVALDRAGCVTLINEQGCRTLEYKREDIIGKNWFEHFLPSELTVTMQELFDKLIKGERDFSEFYENPVRSASGKIRDIFWHNTAIRDSDGKIIGTISAAEDITEKKAAQKRIDEAQKKYESLINTVDGVVWEAEAPTFRCSFISARAESLFGFPPALWVRNSMFWEEHLFPEDRERAIAQSMIAVQNKLPCELEYRFVDSKGKVLWVRDIVSVLVQNDEVVALRGIMLDITAEKNAEIELLKSQELLEQTGKIASVGGWELDLIHSELKWTAETKRIHEVPPDYTPNLETAINFYVPEAKDIIAKAVEKAIKDGTPWDLELPLITAKGNRIIVRAIGEVAFAEQNKPVRLWGTFQDITKIKKAQDLLRENEEKFRSIVTSMNDIIYTLDTDGRHTAVYGDWVKNSGLTDDFLLGKTAREIMGASAAEIHEVHNHIALQGQNTIYEWESVAADGEKKYYQTALSPLHDGNGNILGIVGIGRDVTNLKTASEALRQSEHATLLLLDSIPDGLLIINKEGIIIRLNDSVKTILGYSPAELLWQNMEILLPERYRKNHRKLTAMFHAQPSRRSMGADREVWTLRKDGTEIPVNIRLNPIHFSGEDVVLVTLIDVSERKLMEKQILRAQRMESIGTLAGGIAHDLNNIFTPILLSVDNLERFHSDEMSKKLVQMIKSSTMRGSGLINQVLSFARGVEGEKTLLQIKHLIVEIGKIIEETFPKNIQLRIDVMKDLPPITGDTTQIHQVLLNFCVNARDAMPNGGLIEITAETKVVDQKFVQANIEARVGKYVVVKVKDQGMGIPPEVVDRIFEPFFTTKEVGKGTGLGLSTVMAIVKGHGGFLQVESQVNVGSAFSAYFHVAESAEFSLKEQSKTKLYEGNSETILVIDDEANIREMTKIILESHGFTALTAIDGAEAINIYKQNRDEIALVITDMMMPRMDGTTVIHELHALNPNLKIIAVSGVKHNEDVFFKENVAFLSKPYSVDALLLLIQKALQK